MAAPCEAKKGQGTTLKCGDKLVQGPACARTVIIVVVVQRSTEDTAHLSRKYSQCLRTKLKLNAGDRWSNTSTAILFYFLEHRIHPQFHIGLTPSSTATTRSGTS